MNRDPPDSDKPWRRVFVTATPYVRIDPKDIPPRTPEETRRYEDWMYDEDEEDDTGDKSGAE